MRKLISILCMFTCVVSFVACGNDNNGNGGQQNTQAPTQAQSTQDTTDNKGTGVTETETLKVGKAEYAAHGTKGFSVAFAVLQGDTIVASYVDDYQVMSKDETTVVPNSDKDFGGYFSDSKSSLASKRENNQYYSNLMKDKAGSTIDFASNLDAIANYAVGKTVGELKAELDQKDDSKMVDAVSGSTLADTKGYLMAILKAAENAQGTDNAINNEKANDQGSSGNPSAVDKNNDDLSQGADNATSSPAATGNQGSATNKNSGTNQNAGASPSASGVAATAAPTKK